MPSSPSAERPTPKDWPVYWFAALESAIAENDWQKAAEAHRELERLGVSVTFQERKGVTDAK